MQRGYRLFMMMWVWIGILLTSACAQSDVEGTWVKSCSYDPIPGEKKPNYSIITATLRHHHIDIEINYFTDSACRSPWKLMPTFLQSGSYRTDELSIKKKIKGKKRVLVPVRVHITHYDNHARFRGGRDFTVYFEHFSKAYFYRNGRLFTLYKAVAKPEARLAEEVYEQKNNVQVCVISMKIASRRISWCLENVSFPKQKFQVYCEASKPEKNGKLHYDYTCPTELKYASCLYGLQELGHNLRRWYSKEEIKTNPLAQKACKEQLRGQWNK